MQTAGVARERKAYGIVEKLPGDSYLHLVPTAGHDLQLRRNSHPQDRRPWTHGELTHELRIAAKTDLAFILGAVVDIEDVNFERGFSPTLVVLEPMNVYAIRA